MASVFTYKKPGGPAPTTNPRPTTPADYSSFVFISDNPLATKAPLKQPNSSFLENAPVIAQPKTISTVGASASGANGNDSKIPSIIAEAQPSKVRLYLNSIQTA